MPRVIVLGIDPGSRRCGYGVVARQGGRLRVLESGVLVPGERPMAERLRVNRNTVAKAYNELENQGVIETRAGRGCFVLESDSPLKKEARRKLLIEEIDPVIVQAHHLRVPMDELVQLVEDRVRAFQQQQLKNNEPV